MSSSSPSSIQDSSFSAVDAFIGEPGSNLTWSEEVEKGAFTSFLQSITSASDLLNSGTQQELVTAMSSSSSDPTEQAAMSSTNSEAPYTPYSERPETYIVPIVFLFIYITGLIGNCTLIYVMLKEKLLRTPSYMFILNLAFGDLLVIICTVPFVGTIYTFESWPFGLIVCKASEFIRDVSNNVTVLTLCAMSIDRYRAAFSTTLRSNVRTYYTAGTSGHSGNSFCNILGCTSLCNLSSLRLFKTLVKFIRSPTGIVMSAIWTISLLAAFPTGYFSFILEYPISKGGPGEVIKVCFPYPEELGDYYPKIVVASKCIFLYIIPTIIIGYCYVSIAIHLMYKAKSSISSTTNYGSSLPNTTTTSATTSTTPITTAATSKMVTTTTTTMIKSPNDAEVPLISSTAFSLPSKVATGQVAYNIEQHEKAAANVSSSTAATTTSSIRTAIVRPLLTSNSNDRGENGGSTTDRNSEEEDSTCFSASRRSNGTSNKKNHYQQHQQQHLQQQCIRTSCSSNGTCCPSSSSSSSLCLFPSHPSSCSSSRHSSPSSSDWSLKLSNEVKPSKCTCCCHFTSGDLSCDEKTRTRITSTSDTSETCYPNHGTSITTQQLQQNPRHNLTQPLDVHGKFARNGQTPYHSRDDVTDAPDDTVNIGQQKQDQQQQNISISPSSMVNLVEENDRVNRCKKCRQRKGITLTECKWSDESVCLQIDPHPQQLHDGNTTGVEIFAQSSSPSNVGYSNVVDASKSKFNSLSRSFTINTVANLCEGASRDLYQVERKVDTKDGDNCSPTRHKLSEASVNEKFKCTWTFDRKNLNRKSNRSQGSRGRFISSLAKDKAAYSEMKLVDPSSRRYLEESTSLRSIKSRLLQLSGRSLVGSIHATAKGSADGSTNGCLNGGKGGKMMDGVSATIPPPANSVLHKSRKKSQSRAKIILLLVVIFLICFFPNHLFMVWFYFYPDAGSHYNSFWHVWRIVAFCLTFLNSTLNPITLYLTSDQFKHLFNKYLLKCFPSENIREATSNSGDSSNVITNNK